MLNSSYKRLWPSEQVVIRMTDSSSAEEKLFLASWGAFLFGYNLERLEWALSNAQGMTNYLATFVEPFRLHVQTTGFEDIGREATFWHNHLSNQIPQVVSDTDKNALREVRTRWQTLVQERLGRLYLITPTTGLDISRILQGLGGFLSEQDIAILGPSERQDLIDALKCILMTSPTPAEYMALRTSESLLRRWYEKKTGRTIVHQTWGVVLDKLIDEYPERNRPKEIALLGYLKLRRDEVAHPERSSTMLDAESTVMQVFTMIVGIRKVFAALPLDVPLGTTPQLTASQSRTDSNEP